jgi:V-type H+-transporting ATPase proteolipid subunit
MLQLIPLDAMGQVLATFGALLAAGLGAAGAAIGIGFSGSAMIGTIAERPETFSKSMIAVVLAEALGIYGLLASFMILMRLPTITNAVQGMIALGAGLSIGIAAIGAGIGIAYAGSSMCTSLAEAPETFSKALVSVVLAEALGIYGLLASFMLLMRIEGAVATQPGAGLIAIAAGLAIGIAALGAGVGIAKSGASLCKSLVRAPETFSKGLVSVVLAEALGIYGLLASFMLLMRIEGIAGTLEQQMGAGFLALAAGLGIGLAALGAGYGIASGGAALSDSLVEKPEIFSKGLVAVVLAEALGIYGLLASFMLLMRIDQVQTAGNFGQGILGLAAGLAIGLAGIGAGIGIAKAGGALSRSLVRAPEAFSKSLVSVVLAEALGIYGLLLSFMLIMRIDGLATSLPDIAVAQGLLGIGAGIAIGLSCLGAGFGIAYAGESLSFTIADKPETFSKGLVSVVLAEALGIYGLLIGFMVVMRVDQVPTALDPMGQGWLAIASGFSIALAAIGGGIGIGLGGAALCSSLRFAPESFSKGLVAVVLAEALGIYGLLASFMLVMRLDAVTIGTAFTGMSAALTVGVGGLVAGIAIGWAGASMVGALVNKPEVFSKSMVPVVLAEALAIYTLLVAFMLIMQI